MTLIINEDQRRVDKSMGWHAGDAQGGLEIHSTPGGHWTRYLHGKELAKRLTDCIRGSNSATTRQIRTDAPDFRQNLVAPGNVTTAVTYR
ncbi:MAG: hypothetical protein JO331_01545 [Verrucomicrobia bacterium]|nr:hypothetical protein [Verrucomicrobiota bacterium]